MCYTDSVLCTRDTMLKSRSRDLVIPPNLTVRNFRHQFCKEGEQLENYTKYRLKAMDELTALLSEKDNLFVIACNKCFKEFETLEEPDC